MVVGFSVLGLVGDESQGSIGFLRPGVTLHVFDSMAGRAAVLRSPHCGLRRACSLVWNYYNRSELLKEGQLTMVEAKA